MKKIQSFSDIVFLTVTHTVSMALIRGIVQDFIGIYEAENDAVDLVEYRLPPGQTLFVFEKGDDVLDTLHDPMALEYVEKVKIEQLEYYRCVIRMEHDFQIYYSPINSHDEETEHWLQEKAE
jgi:hypothetical protein